ncbi:cyclin-K-like [Microplitis mediator]|uniref:cyclin-K-like n=1 Tax=Microplitis mediator TaxID=375433 RepID=UPI0025553D74|nr:cyclin-K-like [Microplitis mediator]
MPCWYYNKNELKQTPSIINDSIDYDTECRYRQEGVRFIVNLGTSLNLIFNNTIATGVIYFHRFYMKHSFKQFPRYITACACLFLAGKVEETPKKCRDIIETAKALLTEQKFSSIFGKDPKEKIMTLEKILLQTIKFDLQVEHPYSYLLKYVKCLKGDKSKLQKKLQMAWNFVNDSLSTTLSLQWEPEIIAVAVMYLAGKLNKFKVIDWDGRQPNHLRWWDMFVEDITLELLEDICHQVLDTYNVDKNALQKNSQSITPNPLTEPQLPSTSTESVSNILNIETSSEAQRPELQPNDCSEPQPSVQPVQLIQQPQPATSVTVLPTYTAYSQTYSGPRSGPASLPVPVPAPPISYSSVYPPANMSVPPPVNPVNSMNPMIPMHLVQPDYSIPPPPVPSPYQYAYPNPMYYSAHNPPPTNRPYQPSS